MRNLIVFLMLIGCACIINAKAQPSFFDVKSYDAVIAPDLNNKSVTGKVRVTFESLSENLSEITLNAGSLEIDSIQERLKFKKTENLLIIYFEKPLKKDETRTIEIYYHGTPRFGINFFPEKNQVYTIFSTSQWMPCVDAPSDRASFRLYLVTPGNVKAVGNGEFLRERELSNGKIMSLWEQKTEVPTYLFGFAFGEFQELNIKNGLMTFRYLFDKSFSETDIRKIFVDAKKMLAFYEKKAGVKYPYKIYTQVLTEGDAQQEVDGFTLMTADYGRDVLKDETKIWLGAHEFAHQFWGNMVTNRDWTHFWLNEGFANFMTAAYFEKRFGRAAYNAEIERYKTSYEKVRDAGKDKSLVFPNWNKPTREDRRLVYDKGAYVLHLLRLELGEKLFWKGFREYTQTYWGKSVETKDFQNVMEKTSRKDLSKFFDKWIYLKSD